MTTATVDNIAPRVIIIPQTTDHSLSGAVNISGQLLMSGSELYIWNGAWGQCTN